MVRVKKINLIVKLLTALIFLSTVAWPLHSAEIKDFRYYKDAGHDGRLKNSDIAIIRFDNEMYRNTINLFNDLMVTDGDLKPLPFVVQKQTQLMLIPHPEECTVKILEYSADFQTVIFENVNRIFASEIQLFSKSGNYEKIVDVFASKDCRNWVPIKKGAILLNIESLKIKQNTVSFLSDNSHYFKVEVRNPDKGHVCPGALIYPKKSFSETDLHAENIRIDALKLFHNITLSRPVDTYTTQIDLKLIQHRINDYEYETVMASMCQPLLGFKFIFPEDNHLRSIAISGSNDGKNWNILSEGTYINLSLPDYRLQHDYFTIPESRYQYYLFRYNKVGSEQYFDLTVKANAAIYNIVMPGDVLANFKVFYGGKAIHEKTGKAIIRQTRNPLMVEYRLSAQKFNPDYGLDNHLSMLKIFFLFVIISITIILALSMWRFIRNYSDFHNKPL